MTATRERIERIAENLAEGLAGFALRKVVLKEHFTKALTALWEEMEREKWLPIETCPENQAVLIYLPGWEHYGPAVYRGMLVNTGTGKRWFTSAWKCGRDFTYGYPTHWQPLPQPPAT